MKATTILGALLGGIWGYAFTRIERQAGETTHMIMGTLAGASIGALAIHHVIKTGVLHEGTGVRRLS